MTYELRINEASPTANKYAYAHWRVRHSDKKRWAKLLMVEAATRQIPAATGPRVLTLERHGRRRLDPDNMIGGAKGIIDELRKLKLLLNDDDKSVQIMARNVKLVKGETPYTVIILEDMCIED